MVFACKEKEPCQNQFSILLLRILHRSLNNSAEFAILFFALFLLSSLPFYHYCFVAFSHFCVCVCSHHLCRRRHRRRCRPKWQMAKWAIREKRKRMKVEYIFFFREKEIVARRKYAARNEILNLSLEITSNSVENVKSCWIINYFVFRFLCVIVAELSFCVCVWMRAYVYL